MLLNLGGPDSLDSVKPFLLNLFSDRMIMRFPGPASLQKPIAWAIATARAGKARRAYALIGGKSPLNEFTYSQARAIRESLEGEGDFRVYSGMRYWRPYISEAVREMDKDGIRKVIALSLYPHYSIATTGSSMHELGLQTKKYSMDLGSIDHWCDHPLYIEALADTIKKGIASFGGDDIFILFSAHGLPVKIARNDPYAEHIRRTIDAVAEKIKTKESPVQYALSYQSRTGPVKWLSPYTDEMLRELGRQGVKKVLVVPVSFVSDHIETLYEIDILYKRLASGLGMDLRRTTALNSHPLLIGAFKEMILRRKKELDW